MKARGHCQTDGSLVETLPYEGGPAGGWVGLARIARHSRWVPHLFPVGPIMNGWYGWGGPGHWGPGLQGKCLAYFGAILGFGTWVGVGG